MTKTAVGMDDVIASSEAEDKGKFEKSATSKETSFFFEHNKDAGKTLFFVAPDRVGRPPKPEDMKPEDKWYFTPFSWAQFHSKILGYPSKALSTELISSRLIKMIADERKQRVKERQVTLKLKRDDAFRNSAGKEGKVIFRGAVNPSAPGYSTTSVLKMLARLGEQYDLELRGRPSFPDHFFYATFVMGDELDIGDADEPMPVRLGVYLAHSEVGAVSGGMRLDSVVYDETQRTAIVIRAKDDKPLFRLRGDHKDMKTFEEEVEAALAQVHKCGDQVTSSCQSARGKVYERWVDTLVTICRRYGVDGTVGRKIIEAFEERLKASGGQPTKAAIIQTICEVAREERADRSFELSVIAGRVLLDETL